MGTLNSTRFYSAHYLLSICLVIGLTACGGGGGDGGDNDSGGNVSAPSPSQGSDLHIDEVRDRVLAWYPVGITNEPSNRNVRDALVNEGWNDSGFIPNVLDALKANDRGFHRVLLHTPCGRVKPVQFDAFLEASDMQQLHRVTEGFVDAWRRNVTDPALGRNIEVIGYIGNPDADEDSRRVYNNQGEAAFFDRAWKAVQPLLDAEMAIGIDGAAATEKDSLTYRFTQKLKERASKVYIEANPAREDEWWLNEPVIVLDETWRKRENNDMWASREEIGAELIRIVRTDREWVEGHSSTAWPAEVCQVLADGDSVAISWLVLQDPQRSLQDLVDCANERRN